MSEISLTFRRATSYLRRPNLLEDMKRNRIISSLKSGTVEKADHGRILAVWLLKAV